MRRLPAVQHLLSLLLQWHKERHSATATRVGGLVAFVVYLLDWRDKDGGVSAASHR
jgi:hypothetical protein